MNLGLERFKFAIFQILTLVRPICDLTDSKFGIFEGLELSLKFNSRSNEVEIWICRVRSLLYLGLIEH